MSLLKNKIVINKFFSIFLSILFSLQLQSCSKNNRKKESLDVNIFSEEHKINSEIVVTSDKLLDPTIIEVIDSMIIVSNYKADNLIEIYDIHGNILKKTISKGRGPGEIYITGRIQIDESNKVFYVNDLISKKVLKCDLIQLLENENYLPTTIFDGRDYNKIENIFYDKLVVGEDIFIAENRSPEGRLSFIDKKGQTLGHYFSFPSKELINKKLNDFDNSSLYSSAITINPQLSKVALATYSAGMLDLFNVEKINNPSLIWSYKSFYPTGIKIMPMGETTRPFHTSKSKLGYMDLASTNNYVYALFSGTTSKDSNYGYGNIIQVISWSADKFFELHLDRYIKRLAVSSDGNKIYGISRNENGEPELVVFNISSLKF